MRSESGLLRLQAPGDRLQGCEGNLAISALTPGPCSLLVTLPNRTPGGSHFVRRG